MTVHFDPNATAGGETITITGTVAQGERRARSRREHDRDHAVAAVEDRAERAPARCSSRRPGLFLANEGGGGHADQVFLRGFDAEQGQDIEFTVDGVPINEVDNTDGHGYADTHFIIPEVVKSLRVIEGPFDPHQGDFAVAGSADYELGVAERGLEFEQTIGSVRHAAHARAVGAARPSARARSARSQIYNTRRLRREPRRAPPRARWPVRGHARRARPLAAARDRVRHALQVRRRRARRRRRGRQDRLSTAPRIRARAATPSATRCRSASRTRSTDGVAKQQVFLTYRTLRIVEDFTGFLLDNPRAGPVVPPAARRRDRAGLRRAHRRRARLVSANRPRCSASRSRSSSATTRATTTRSRRSSGCGSARDIPYLIDTTLTTDVVNLAAVSSTSIFIRCSWLTLRGGVRQEFFSYDVLNNCATDGEYQREAAARTCCARRTTRPARASRPARITATGVITEPKVTAIAQLPGGISLTASYGIGAQSLDAAVHQPERECAVLELTRLEGGAIYHGTGPHRRRRSLADLDVTARAVGYYTHVDRDLIFDPLQGRLSASTGTTRRGAGARRARGRALVQRARVGHLRLRDLRSGPHARAVRAEHGRALGHVDRARAPCGVAIDGHPADRQRRARAQLRRHARAAARPDSRSRRSRSTPRRACAGSGSSSACRSQNLSNARYPLTEYFYASDFHNGPAYATLAPALNFTAAPPRTVMFTLAFLLDDEGAR